MIEIQPDENNNEVIEKIETGEHSCSCEWCSGSNKPCECFEDYHDLRCHGNDYY
jgi:hypothetical protein